jgi:Polysaccharide pyruvyl transferase
MKFWWHTIQPGNFGDILTPCILDYFKIPHEYSRTDFDAICIGSIAKLARPGTVVMGSGIISDKDGVCADADWRFVRGPLTRQKVLDAGGTCSELYGDPALLLPLIVDSSPKKYDVGIIPHHSQYANVKERYPKHRVINLKNNDPIAVAKEITECRMLYSSSLHGIITAHAYGIPVARVEFSKPIKGDGVKFLDHYAAMGLDPRVSSIKDPYFTDGFINLKHIISEFEYLKYQTQCA